MKARSQLKSKPEIKLRVPREEGYRSAAARRLRTPEADLQPDKEEEADNGDGGVDKGVSE